jgi:tyrosinase
MLEIARKFKDPLKQQYLGAVQRFRLPYWDYFRPRAKKDVSFRGIMWPKSHQSLSKDETSFPYDFSIPQIFTVSKVMVRKPDQTELTEFDNPFASFDFSSGRFKKEDWELIAGQKVSLSQSRNSWC